MRFATDRGERMKNAPGAGRRDGSETFGKALPPPSFAIDRLAREDAGNKVARFQLVVESVITLSCSLFRSPATGELFVTPTSVLSRAGKWRRCAWFEQEFAEAVRDAVVARLEADAVTNAS